MELTYVPTLLTARLNLPCHLLGKDIHKHLERHLRRRYHGKCISQGYVRPNSISLIQKQKGELRPAHFTGEITFKVQYKADLFVPTIGANLQAKVQSSNKAGLLAIIGPLQIIIPRQSHFNHDLSNFDRLQVGDVVLVELVRFRLEREYIYAIGRLVEKIEDPIIIYTLSDDPQIGDLRTLRIHLRLRQDEAPVTAELGDPDPLNERKTLIDPYEKDWGTIRMYINPYELVSQTGYDYNPETVIRYKRVFRNRRWQPTGETVGLEYRPV